MRSILYLRLVCYIHIAETGLHSEKGGKMCARRPNNFSFRLEIVIVKIFDLLAVRKFSLCACKRLILNLSNTALREREELFASKKLIVRKLIQ